MSNINTILTQRCNSRDPDSVLSTRLQIINDIILYSIHISDLDSLKTNFMKVIIPQRGNIDFVTKPVVINTFSDYCWWIPLNMNWGCGLIDSWNSRGRSRGLSQKVKYTSWNLHSTNMVKLTSFQSWNINSLILFFTISSQLKGSHFHGVIDTWPQIGD